MAKDLPPNEDSQETESMDYELEEESEDEELEGWDDWEAEKDDVEEEGDSSDSDFLCFFCDSKYGSCDALFEHCSTLHRFDFRGIRTSLGLDFYGAFKLINYVRSQVSVLFDLISVWLMRKRGKVEETKVKENLGLKLSLD